MSGHALSVTLTMNTVIASALEMLLRQCKDGSGLLDIPLFEEWDFMSHYDAEMFAGQPLPSKYKYLVCNGELSHAGVYLDSCGYCFAYSEDGYARGYWDDDLGTERGTGCVVCEYTGLNANYFVLPYFDNVPF